MQAEIRAVIFDLDGLLLDTESICVVDTDAAGDMERPCRSCCQRRAGKILKLVHEDVLRIPVN